MNRKHVAPEARWALERVLEVFAPRRTKAGRPYGGGVALARAITAATRRPIAHQSVHRWVCVPERRVADVLAAARWRGIPLRACDVRPDLFSPQLEARDAA